MNAPVKKVIIPSKFRKLSSRWKLLGIGMPAIGVILGIIGAFHISPFGIAILETAYLFLLVCVFLPLTFMWIPPSGKARKDRVPWHDLLLMLLAFGIPFYFFLNATQVMSGWMVPGIGGTHVLVLTIILWAVAIEAARRGGGPVFAAFLLFFSIFPLIGSYMPGVLNTNNFPFARVALYNILGVEGFLGLPLQTFAKLFFGFMAFAVGLQVCGVGKFFNQLAIALMGRTRGGNAKIAIFASALFGTVSGNPGANVFTTGVFTIPAMKNDGFKAEFAGAVEATASSGGALMPPIMGAVAFIMAQYLEISYGTVCMVALVPSILYFVCLFAQIDAYAARHRLGVGSRLELELPEKVGTTILKNIHLIIGFGSLLFFLFYLRLETWSPWIATGVTFAGAMIRKQTRLSLHDFGDFLESLGQTLGQMMGIMGPVGMMIGAFILTGIAFSIPYEIVALAGGNIYILLVAGALASFILGMGVSISACYLFLAIVLAPALVAGGIHVLAAHMFVLYCGVWSYITPPVALACFSASVLSGADPMKIALQSMRLGIGKYLLPFFFVLSPAMLLIGAPLDYVHIVLRIIVRQLLRLF